jgi:hypothetical protein
VGDVELPALVGLLHGEAPVAAFRALMRLRDDEPADGRDPPDRGDRRDRVRAMAPVQVGGDGGGAGLVPAAVELFAQGDDLVLGRLRGPARAAMRAAE